MRKFVPLFALAVLLSSCSHWVSPPYTSVDKMIKVDKGMSLDETNNTLGIKPYDILHSNDSTKVVMYNYRLKKREVNQIPNLKKYIHSDASQNEGTPYYKEPGKLYAIFDSDGLSSLITDNGYENSDFILFTNNNIILVSRRDMMDFDFFEEGLFKDKLTKDEVMSAVYTNKHAIMLHSKILHAPFGVKYAYLNKFGGYGSFATDAGIDIGIGYISGGGVAKINRKYYGYAGVGMGPGRANDDIEIKFLHDFMVEGGIIGRIGRFAIDAGFVFDLNGSTDYYDGNVYLSSYDFSSLIVGIGYTF